MSYSEVGFHYAKKVLESRGYAIFSITNMETNKMIKTDKGKFFLKNDTRPWKYPLDVSFSGPGMAVFAHQFERYIFPQMMDWLYYWGETNTLYHVPYKEFVHGAQRTKQNNGDPVYVYPLNKAKRFDMPLSYNGGLDVYV